MWLERGMLRRSSSRAALVTSKVQSQKSQFLCRPPYTRATSNMAEDSKIKEFPDIGSKLTAPTKKSLFERQKAEAEAKRQREQEETAAVYEDFIKSFDDEDKSQHSDPSALASGPGLGGSRGGAFGGPSKRHFSGPASRGRGNSGPGSLGPPPSSLSRKRAYDGSQPPRKEANQGLFAFEDSIGPADTKTAFQTSDDEDTTSHSRAAERAAPKPTLRLSSLPPGTSPAVIKSVLPSNLKVEGVRILPPSGPGSSDRRSLSAIVTLAEDTPAIEIDTAVSALQNRYMGRGFYLSLSRHLSSAAGGTEMPSMGTLSATSSLPFDARPIPTGPGAGFGRAQPSTTHRGGYAPPQSYATNSGQYGRGAPPVQVNVAPPPDLKQIKLIHKTVEALISNGPEFEALLMTRRDVQMEEKWAWLWDPRSVGGVWYRWRLWDVLTGAQSRIRARKSSSSQHLFEGGAPWAAPEKGLPFEYTTRIEEFVSDSDYNSSDDEDSGDEGRRRYSHHHGGAPPPDPANLDGDDQAYLTPLEKAKLTHLLARLPASNAKLRRGDVARITAFAIQHAGEGAEEVVQMITSNVLKPFAFSGARPDRKASGDDAAPKDEDETNEDEKRTAEKEDTSSSKLVGLYIISDILSSSSTSGVRHAWRYRQLFEAALKQSKVFENLGRLEKTMSWGRLRAEKWKRSVNSILGLWEGWCVFPQASQEHFSTVFASPPLTTAEEAANIAAEKSSGAASAAKSRWKTVDEKAQEREALKSDVNQMAPPDEVDTMDVDVDGEPMADDEDLDGEPMDDDEDVDGEPMEDSDDKEMKDDEGSDVGSAAINSKSNDADKQVNVGFKLSREVAGGGPKHILPGGRGKRPKAEDMFADSDGE